jgi:3-hydroxyacyl-[acyl-carrier-protein] dehydratase
MSAPQPVFLDIKRILQVLPHRYPMLMLDRVTEVEPNRRAVGHKMVSASEPWAQGHFPGNPVLPGVLILEAMAQLGAVLAYASEPFDLERSNLYFLGIDKAKFRLPVIPGDRLQLEVTVLQRRSNLWKLSGEASVDGRRSAHAELLAAVVDRPTPT